MSKVDVISVEECSKFWVHHQNMTLGGECFFCGLKRIKIEREKTESIENTGEESKKAEN